MNKSMAYDSIRWFYGGGMTDNAEVLNNISLSAGPNIVKLVAYNECGSDTLTKVVMLAANGQSATTTFLRTYGSTGNDVCNSFWETNDGYLAAGYSDGLTSNKTNANGKDIYLMKTDKYGNQVWAISYGGTGDEEINIIRPDGIGSENIIMGGYTSTFSGTNNDVLVQKIDGSGNFVWANTFGGTGDESAKFIKKTSDQGYIVVGQTNSAGAGNNDIFVMKLDSTGNEQWQKAYGSTGEETAVYVEEVSGQYVIGGTTDGAGSGGTDGFAMKIDGSGNFVWANTYGSTGDESFNSGKIDGSGNFVWAGSTNSVGNGGDDGMVMKIDGSGNFVWANAYGSTGDESINDGKIDGSGNFVWAGSTNSIGNGGDDGMVMKIDGSGNFVWANAYGSTGNDGAKVAYSTNDGIIAWGNAAPNPGDNDIFCFKMDSVGNTACDQSSGNISGTTFTATKTALSFTITNDPFGTSVSGTNNTVSLPNSGNIAKDSSLCSKVVSNSNIFDSKTQESIDVYPNPSTGIFTIDMQMIEGNATIEVYNILGARVHLETVKVNLSEQRTIKLAGHKSGIYILKVHTANKTYTQKLIFN